MKYFSLFFFIAFTLPEFCFGQSTIICNYYNPTVETILWLGPMGGINFNHYQTSSFPYPGLDPAVISEQNGNGIAPMFGISCELPLDPANNKLLVFDFFYDSKSAAFNSGSAKNVDLQKIIFYHGPGDINTDFSASLSYFMVSAGFKYNFREYPAPQGLGVQLSLSAGFLLSNDFHKTLSITVFDSASHEKYPISEKYDFPIERSHNLRLGLRGKLSYDIPLKQWFNISPFIGYDLPLTKVDDTDRSWKASAFYAGIAAHFSIVLVRD